MGELKTTLENMRESEEVFMPDFHLSPAPEPSQFPKLNARTVIDLISGEFEREKKARILQAVARKFLGVARKGRVQGLIKVARLVDAKLRREAFDNIRKP